MVEYMPIVCLVLATVHARSDSSFIALRFSFDRMHEWTKVALQQVALLLVLRDTVIRSRVVGGMSRLKILRGIPELLTLSINTHTQNTLR